MSKPSFPWILTGILFFSFAAFHVAGLAVAGLGCGVAYVGSLRLHPRMRHGRCKGTGEVRGAVFTWTHRKCPGTVCQGGRQIRWGAGHFGAGHIQGFSTAPLPSLIPPARQIGERLLGRPGGRDFAPGWRGFRCVVAVSALHPA